jgi:SMI1-KNR4 cell-wall
LDLHQPAGEVKAMDRDEFESRVEAARSKNPVWFELEGDPPATNEEVMEAETALGVLFPEAYREFLKDYGGGCFAFANVFSVKTGSEWNVVERNRNARLVGSGLRHPLI